MKLFLKYLSLIWTWEVSALKLDLWLASNTPESPATDSSLTAADTLLGGVSDMGESGGLAGRQLLEYVTLPPTLGTEPDDSPGFS